MSSRSHTPPAGHAPGARRRSRSPRGLPSLSEKQTQAYLAARDTLRRIQRLSTLVVPPAWDGGSDRTRADERRGRRCA